MKKILSHLTSPTSVAKAIANPKNVYNYLKENDDPHKKRKELQTEFRTKNFVPSLEVFFNVETNELKKYMLEFEQDVVPYIEKNSKIFDEKPFSMGGIKIEAPVLYAALRVKAPRHVAEVGVANGVSSYYILSALEKNGNDGELTSVDIPKYESDHSGEWSDSAGAWIPEGKDVGWIVPKEYEANWDLQIGDMNELLPEITANKNNIESYIYDGPKKYLTRKKGLGHVHEMEEGCLVFCDDIAWNDSFEDFVTEDDFKWETYGNIGLGIKD